MEPSRIFGILSDKPTLEEYEAQLLLAIDKCNELQIDLDWLHSEISYNRKKLIEITNWVHQASESMEETKNCIKGFIKKYYEDKAHPDKNRPEEKERGIVPL